VVHRGRAGVFSPLERENSEKRHRPLFFKVKGDLLEGPVPCPLLAPFGGGFISSLIGLALFFRLFLDSPPLPTNVPFLKMFPLLKESFSAALPHQLHAVIAGLQISFVRILEIFRIGSIESFLFLA